MKSLVAAILILLAAISAGAQSTAGAQSIVDAARQERARQAKVSSARIFTDANAHSEAPAAPEKPSAPVTAAPAKAPIPAGAKPPAVAPAAAPAITIENPIQTTRARIRVLEDQETALKLQINDVTNQVYAPVTDQAAHSEALTKLADTQTRLTGVQNELAQTRATLQQMEAAQAAPKP